MKISVLVNPRPNKRSREFYVYMGQQFLKDLFDTNKDLTNITEMYLEYPERWLNILELCVLYQAIEQRCPNMKSLDILTHSEHIWTVTAKENLRVIQNAYEYPEVGYTPSTRYSPLYDFDNLNIQEMFEN